MAVLTPKPLIDVPAYLSAHDLFTQVTVIVVSVADAINFLEATPADCLLVTSSPADIEGAQAEGVAAIGYAPTPDAAARLADAGATAVVYSMADLALTLRAHPLDL